MALRLTAPFRRRRSSAESAGQGRRPSQFLHLALLGCLVALPLQAQAESRNAETGNKGAQIYCFMRGNGNSHQVSWDAAYAVIKRQGDRLFRTSPQHAAVLITEAVVANPEEFPQCGGYLGDLFTQPDVSDSSSTPKRTTGTTRSDRYGS
jgi:hypothetical protein